MLSAIDAAEKLKTETKNLSPKYNLSEISKQNMMLDQFHGNTLSHSSYYCCCLLLVLTEL